MSDQNISCDHPSLSTIKAELKIWLKKYNPCDIKMIEGQITCNGGKPCCTGCQFLKESGCSVIGESLACMFYLCPLAYVKISENAKRERLNLINLCDKSVFERNNPNKPLRLKSWMSRTKFRGEKPEVAEFVF